MIFFIHFVAVAHDDCQWFIAEWTYLIHSLCVLCCGSELVLNELNDKKKLMPKSAALDIFNDIW